MKSFFPSLSFAPFLKSFLSRILATFPRQSLPIKRSLGRFSYAGISYLGLLRSIQRYYFHFKFLCDSLKLSISSMNQQTNITIHNLIFRIHGLDLYLSTDSRYNNNHFLIKRRALEQTIPYIHSHTWQFTTHILHICKLIVVSSRPISGLSTRLLAIGLLSNIEHNSQTCVKYGTINNEIMTINFPETGNVSIL
jgi:hypothetical protein